MTFLPESASSKRFLIAGIIFTVIVVALTIIGIVRYEAQDDTPMAEGTAPLVLCLTDDAPSDYMRRSVDKLEDRWKGTVLLVIDGRADCDAELRFSPEMSPVVEDDYAPGVAVRECADCMPYAMIYKDGWEGGIFGAGQFVLDHEVGHLLCLEHWPAASAAVMRPSIWGGDSSAGPDDPPRPAMITPDVLAAARLNREAGCIGPVAESVR